MIASPRRHPSMLLTGHYSARALAEGAEGSESFGLWWN